MKLANENPVSSYQDLIFEHRHKAYGAYDLRKRYNSHLRNGMIAAVLIASALFLPPLLREKKPFVVLEPTSTTGCTLVFHDLPELPNVEDTKTKQTKSDNSERLATRIVEHANYSHKRETMHSADPVYTGAVGPFVNDGNTNPPSTSGHYFPPLIIEKKIFDANEVDENPEFPGGYPAMAKFMQEHLRFPQRALETGIQGTVYLQFIVSPEGKIENLKVIKNVGGGCDEEAMRVAAKMPDWKPGKQKGEPVSVYVRMPVNFVTENP